MLDDIDAAKILLVGDTHGDLPWLEIVCARAVKNDCKIVIQLGDFGYLFDVDKVPKAQALLERYDLHMLFLLGNHDAFPRWEDEYDCSENDESATRVQIKSTVEFPVPGESRLTYLPRGCRFTLNDRTFMAFGGAVSVDKDRRIPFLDWWPQEAITQEQVDRVEKKAVDVFLSHDVPLGVRTIEDHAKKYNWMPDRLTRESYWNRKLLRDVWDKTNPILTCHGHWHYFYQDRLKGRSVMGLNRNGSPRSMAVLDTHTLALTIL